MPPIHYVGDEGIRGNKDVDMYAFFADFSLNNYFNINNYLHVYSVYFILLMTSLNYCRIFNKC